MFTQLTLRTSYGFLPLILRLILWLFLRFFLPLFLPLFLRLFLSGSIKFSGAPPHIESLRSLIPSLQPALYRA
ncbi:hypothetical protein BGX38DRAFT_339897 [Terfezia claveryi]|nr:hypothetical protein BGX38DRAFT_339897 [Terfezia claveryi]